MILRDLARPSTRQGRVLSKRFLTSDNRELLAASVGYMNPEGPVVEFVMYLASREWEYAVGVHGAAEVVALMQSGVELISRLRHAEATRLGDIRDKWRLQSSESTTYGGSN